MASTATTAVDTEALRAELEASVLDAVRRATTRAEHIRLVRIQSLIHALHSVPAD